mgnify:FL=1
MDLLTLCLCCLVASVVIFVVALVLGQKRMRQVEAVMRQVGERHGASFTPGNLIFNPCITFAEGDLQLRMYAALGGRDDPSHTELRVWLPESYLAGMAAPAVMAGSRAASGPAMHIRPHSFSTRLTVTLGAKPYLTGEQEFDETFDARGAPPALLERCLTADVRRSLLELKAYRPAVRLGRLRDWLIREKDDRFPQSSGLIDRLLHPRLQLVFSTAGLPTEAEAWEARLTAGKLLLNRTLALKPPQE